MIKQSLWIIGLMGAVIYLLALEVQMQMALRVGYATLIPDWGLPLEAFFVVPLIIILTAWAALAQVKTLNRT